MTVQSPASHARTSVPLPTICRFATYSCPRNLLSCSLLGMKTRSRSILSRVHGFSYVNFRISQPADFPAALDRLEELHPLATDHQPDSVLSVKISMGGPFAEHPVRLAAAASAAEENLEHRARQQGRLWPRLRFPPDRVRSGGRCTPFPHHR